MSEGPGVSEGGALKWLRHLESVVEKKRLTILSFDESDWSKVRDSRRGCSTFTLARPHEELAGIAAGSPCLISAGGDQPSLYFGLVRSRAAVSTFDTRIKVSRVVRIRPDTLSEVPGVASDDRGSRELRQQLESNAGRLTPRVSSALIRALASLAENRGPMRAVAESMVASSRFRSPTEQQEDAVKTAMAAFGLSADEPARSLELVGGRATALARVPIMEDSVVEHDARQVPGYSLAASDITGRALFEHKGERLEVYTANRRQLEHVFGVDLIYFNLTKQNVVMLQYKMLERSGDDKSNPDWVYRPDRQLDDEISRMRVFGTEHAPGPYEYRLNPTAFYLKFIKRDGQMRSSAIITPIDHFETLRGDPACRGPRGGLRVSFDSLAGRYLRQSAFLDLLRAGYIGAHAETTAHLKALVEAVLAGDRSVVAAVHTRVARPDASEGESDDERPASSDGNPDVP